MTIGHDENEIGFAHQLGHKRLAADVADVEAQFRHDFDGGGTGRLATHGANNGGRDLDVAAPPDQISKESLRHGAATDIAGADKEDVSHAGLGEAGYKLECI